MVHLFLIHSIRRQRQTMHEVDTMLERGTVHVFVDDRPQYVILDEWAYTELAEAREEAERYRIGESLEDMRGTCNQLRLRR